MKLLVSEGALSHANSPRVGSKREGAKYNSRYIYFAGNIARYGIMAMAIDNLWLS